MKYKSQKVREELQVLLEERSKLEGQIALIETQIDDMETAYLERTLLDGNIYVGWNKNPPLNDPSSSKVSVDSKLKLFSLSSLSSTAFSQLGAQPDRQLSPFGQPRFESKKRKRTKKGKIIRRKIRNIRKINRK